MSKVFDEIRKEALEEDLKEYRQEVASRMIQAGKYGLEEIADISELSLCEIQNLMSTLRS